MVVGINEIWAPANIRFELEEITEDAAREEAAQQEWAALCKRGGQELFGKLAPVIKRFLPELPVEQGVFHIALVHRFPRGFGGRYFPELGLIVAPQAVNPGPAARPLETDEAAGGERPLNPRIMAHELGHALSLQHVALPENLMTSGPDVRGVQRGSKLTEQQIARARKVAAEGKPFIQQRPPEPPGKREAPKKK